jgi:hypothetical protein
VVAGRPQCAVFGLPQCEPQCPLEKSDPQILYASGRVVPETDTRSIDVRGNLRQAADTLNLFSSFKVSCYNASIPVSKAVIPVTNLEINP